MPARPHVTARCLLVLALALAACGEPAARHERFAALLRAQGTDGEPIAGVRAWADGRALGATSAHGLLRAELIGREGSSVELSAACPARYRTEPAARQIVLRRVHGGGAAAGRKQLELDVRCAPIERAAAVIVLADGAGPGLPVRVRGEVVGQTDADGCAHVLVSSPVDATLRVELETADRPELRPRNPIHAFRIEDQDSILLVEQRFAPAPAFRPVRGPARPAPVPRKPQRLD